MSLAEHLFVVVFAFIYPVTGYLGYRRLRRQLADGHRFDRRRLYVNTLSAHVVLFGLVTMLWMISGRPWSLLGLGTQIDERLLTGLALAGIAIALFALRLRSTRLRPDALQHLQRSFGRLEWLLPRRPRELRWFYAVSVSAGVAEETLWRGFLIWYLAQQLPLSFAATAATLAFALAHAYQGARQLPAITLGSAVLTAVYLVSGSLWPCILLHSAVDGLQGRSAYKLLAAARS